MSTCQQANAARHKARINTLYKGLKSGDIATNKRRLEVKVKREKERQIRKGAKKQ